MVIKGLKSPVKEKLDDVALSIELTLISVVQGVALAALGAGSLGVIADLRWENVGYVISGLLFILIFWSGAIIHALSFIDWPFDMWHNFLYFLATFVEVLAFGQLSNPLGWYLFVFLFFLVVMFLYFYDLGIIKRHDKLFQKSAERNLYNHILSEQLYEMKFIVPLGIIFNLGAAIFIYFNNQLLIEQKFHLFLSFIQLIFLVWFLFNSMNSFKKRSKLISECI